MAERFEIVTETLDGHRKQLDDLTERLRGAVDAAKTVSMPTDAYGILCQPFRMMLDPVEQFGIQALQQASQAMTAVSGSVREAARGFHEQDQANADMLRQAGGE
jgi:hypothetical protein